MSDLLAKCEVCRALLDEEDLFCSNCGTEAPRQDRSQKTEARSATHNFECSGCGASMSYSAKQGSLVCPFCASEDLTEKKDAKVLAANRVVPMKLDHEAAKTAMRKWLGRGFWRPGDLSEEAAVVSMKPVYVPYWVFEAETHTYWTADTSDTPAGARGDWYPLSGDHRGKYSGVLVGASGALAPAETAAICPFDLADAVKPDEIDFDDTTVEQFAMPRKYARPLARQGLEARERQAVDDKYIPAKCRNVHVNVRIEGLSSQPMLLPIWIMAYRYKDQVYRFLINGQTGRATGRAPVSWLKIAAAVGIGLIVVILILLIVGAMGG